MIRKVTPITGARFAIIIQLSLVAVICFTIIRIILLTHTRSSIDSIPFITWFYIFGQGLIYDIAFISYFYTPFVLLFLILPYKWLNKTIFKYLVQAGVFAVLYGLGISMFAEWYFWKGFGVRFNFISVDYLVYRREVTDNIIQSYPVLLILSLRLRNQIQLADQNPDKPIYDIGRYVETNGPEKKLNVMLITVESLSAKFLTRFGQKQDITPFMDKWFRQGILFTIFFATGTMPGLVRTDRPAKQSIMRLRVAREC